MMPPDDDDGPTKAELQAQIRQLDAKLAQMGSHFNNVQREVGDLETVVEEAVITRPADVTCPHCGRGIRVHQDGVRVSKVDNG